jgi:hypothetical protein
MLFFHQRAANISAPSQRQSIFFAWLFRAAGCQIDFRQEGYLNLKPPLNALFNSRKG